MKQTLAIASLIVFGLALMYVLATEERRVEHRVIGATALCNSGSFSTSPRGPGVCSGHGGVARWIENQKRKD